MPIPDHESREPYSGDRGFAFGRAQKERVACTVSAYRWLFQEVHHLSLRDVLGFGEAVEERLSGRWPDLLEEIEAMAEGAGQDARELAALNARTEILGGCGQAECSVVAVVPSRFAGQPVLLCQNWDWYERSRGSLVSWRVRSDDGHWFITITEAGILAKIGMNSHSLGCCLNHLNTTRDGGVSGTPIHVLLRLILQQCSDLGEAMAMLENETLSTSSCITLAQANPEPAAVSVELSPGGAERVAPDHTGCLFHTNHFLVAPAAGADTARESPGSRERLEELRRWSIDLQDKVALGDLKSVFRSHQCSPTAICRHVDASVAVVDQSETLTSVLMDLSELRLLFTDGTPCTSVYRPALREHVER